MSRTEPTARALHRTDTMLTQQLRDLEHQGLITRKIFAEVPPRVEDTITPLGRSLRPVLKAMYDWG